jgi:hypothetical protein
MKPALLIRFQKTPAFVSERSKFIPSGEKALLAYKNTNWTVLWDLWFQSSLMLLKLRVSILELPD